MLSLEKQTNKQIPIEHNMSCLFFCLNCQKIQRQCWCQMFDNHRYPYVWWHLSIFFIEFQNFIAVQRFGKKFSANSSISKRLDIQISHISYFFLYPPVCNKCIFGLPTCLLLFFSYLTHNLNLSIANSIPLGAEISLLGIHKREWVSFYFANVDPVSHLYSSLISKIPVFHLLFILLFVHLFFSMWLVKQQ